LRASPGYAIKIFTPTAHSPAKVIMWHGGETVPTKMQVNSTWKTGGDTFTVLLNHYKRPPQ
jgi:hypothetical protein